MKRFTVVPLAFAILMSMSCGRFHASYSAKKKFSVSIPGNGTLHVFTPSGSITVRSGDVQEGQITAQKVVRSSTNEEARRFCEETKISIEALPSGAAVSVELPEKRRRRATITVNVEAIVPASCNLDLKTYNGDVVASGMEGNVEMRTSKGDIAGEDIDGNVHADTSNGDVRLERVAASVQAFTSVGNITCALFSNASATIYGRAISGKIVTDFPLTIKEGRLLGKIGDGDLATIEVQTMNGGITLRKVNARNAGKEESEDNQ